MTTPKVEKLGEQIHTVYTYTARESAGFYNNKELAVATSFTGAGKARVWFHVHGRRDGKPFHYEFKSYDKAVDKYNTIHI